LKKHSLLKKLWGFIGAVVTVLAYNNCGEGFVLKGLNEESVGGSAIFSQGPGETCEDALLKVYKNTYHPFLVQTCNTCHITGGSGNGNFAESNATTSYASFVTKGANLINTRSVTNHQPPYTGPQNQARIDEISGYWARAQTAYASCLTKPSPTPTPTPTPKPPTPTPTPTPPMTTPTPTPTPNQNVVTYTSLMASGGVFASSCVSCHGNSLALGGLNLANYTQAKNAAQKIKTRVNSASNPMPTSGLLPQADRAKVNAWVDGGAPQ